MKKLKGFIQSGTLFVGDPSYMAGDMSHPGAELKEVAENPFYNWDKFSYQMENRDYVLPFTGSTDVDGRGVVVQLNQINGVYEIEKIEDSQGKLVELRIKLND